MKPQAVRGLDVLAIGPAMVYGGALLSPRRPAHGLFLVAAGVATVIYNGRNFRRYL